MDKKTKKKHSTCTDVQSKLIMLERERERERERKREREIVQEQEFNGRSIFLEIKIHKNQIFKMISKFLGTLTRRIQDRRNGLGPLRLKK